MIASGLGLLRPSSAVPLVVCGNTANLMLARVSSRLREVGVRLALGASPVTRVRMLLVENVALALMGAGLGIVIAVWGTNALRAMPPYGASPIRFQTSVDALGSGSRWRSAWDAACSSPPRRRCRWRASTRNRRCEAARDGRPQRNAGRVDGAQVALALPALVAVGLFFKSFAETRLTDPGFRTDGVLLATYDLTGRSSDDDFLARSLPCSPTGSARCRRLRPPPSPRRAAARRSTACAAARSTWKAGPKPAPRPATPPASNVVTPGYFATLGIPLLSGSDFVDLKDTALATRQVIVNQAFVDRYIGAGEVLGRRLANRGRAYADHGGGPELHLRRVRRAAHPRDLLLVSRETVGDWRSPHPIAGGHRGRDGRGSAAGLYTTSTRRSPSTTSGP